MRIAIDYTAAARQGGGIGRYARELISAILKIQSAHTFVLMAATAGLGDRWQKEKERLRKLPTFQEHVTFRTLPITDDWMARLWQRIRLPIPAELFTGRVDLYYSPDFVLPPLQHHTRALLTVHDLSFLRHPETFPPALQQYLENAVPRSVARADHILADSQATRQDLIELLSVPPEKITALYSGVSPEFSPILTPNEKSRLQTRYGIGERPYILSVGTVQPRKNYLRLMEACDPLAKERDLDLVIVGKPAWLSKDILEAGEKRPYVHQLGFIQDGDLPALYRQASTLAFPSLYEGFGLPPLEAMACGTPVVASSASSVPEVVGDAGLLVDPFDIPAWTEALKKIIEDITLRDTLCKRGKTRAAEFTWTRAAQEWLKIASSYSNN